MRTRIKICGITTTEDMLSAVNAGADAIGFVFYPLSKRAITIAQAAEIVAAMPPLVSAVGLFVDPEADFVDDVLAQVALDQLQFHGKETATFCRQFGRRYFKAVPMKTLDQKQAGDYLADYPDACGFLFDAFGGSQQGGSGTAFDWQQIPATEKPVIIAGGLAPENVTEVVRRYHPFAVDVSSGVESAPGVKSSVKINRFIDAVNTKP